MINIWWKRVTILILSLTYLDYNVTFNTTTGAQSTNRKIINDFFKQKIHLQKSLGKDHPNQISFHNFFFQAYKNMRKCNQLYQIIPFFMQLSWYRNKINKTRVPSNCCHLPVQKWTYQNLQRFLLLLDRWQWLSRLYFNQYLFVSYSYS